MVLAWLGVKGDLIDGVLWRTTVESGFRELAPVLAVVVPRPLLASLDFDFF